MTPLLSKSRSTDNRRLTIIALFASLALIFSYVEMLIPIPLGIPGIKLGIANLVIVIAIYRFKASTALSINIIRICLAGLLFTGLFGALYSICGGLISFVSMLAVKKTDKFSMIGVSMTGGVFHNLGQLLAAAFIISDMHIFMYFPVLMFSGIITGIIIGFICYYVNKKIPASLLQIK